MLNNLFYKKLNREKETKDDFIFKLWNSVLNGINTNINSIYYAMENRWWIKSKHFCLCKKCKTNLSFQHILQRHKEFLGKNIQNINWLMKIKKDNNFSKAAAEINGDLNVIKLKIKEILKTAIELKEKAVKELGEKCDEML